MNGVWNTCVKRYVNDFDGFVNLKIVKMAIYIFFGCKEEDIEEFLGQHSEKLTNEELIVYMIFLISL